MIPDAPITQAFNLAGRTITAAWVGTPFGVYYGLAAQRLSERETVLRTVFTVIPERFVRRVPTPPDLPQAVCINNPRTMDEHDYVPVDLEPRKRVARPKVWRRAPAERTLDGNVSSFHPRMRRS